MARRRTGSSGRSSAREPRHRRMSGHALEVLEFERVLERVARRASSELGRERVRALRPCARREDIVRELGRVASVMRFLEEHPDWSLGALPDVCSGR